MPLRTVKSDARCKVCGSPHLADINGLIELRAEGGKDPEGKRLTLPYIVSRMSEWGIENANLDNIKAHIRNHVEWISEEAEAAAEAAADAALQVYVSEGGKVDADGALDRMLFIGMAQLEARIKAGERVQIPPDLMVKIIDAKTRRKHTDAQSELLRAVGGGIATALARRAAPAVGPADPAIEAEFEEIEA